MSNSKLNLKGADLDHLESWYLRNRREFPWRISKNPYHIWLSEVMSQQTTMAAVLPYFEKFVKKFPNIEVLAKSKIEEVVEAWAGLGYYSRARNLHHASQIIFKSGFPQTWQELIELPGLGPYTSRAVASIAFAQKCGVVDGNVIRVLCRLTASNFAWWETEKKALLQTWADQLVVKHEPSHINQALMELGASVCTPAKPLCHLCPLTKRCLAKNHNPQNFPRKKPRRTNEKWLLEVYPQKKNGLIAMVPNKGWPFLKGHWVLPGKAAQIQKKPSKYLFKHQITHHEIYVCIGDPKKIYGAETKWVSLEEANRLSPTSLLRKFFKIYPALENGI